MTFKDHFSANSQEYSEFRPCYPEALFSYLATLSTAHDLAWDCATGSGQAAVGLASYFSRVVATDASAEQIANATEQKGVSYAVAQAQNSGLDANTVDLVTVAQALHWFDIEAFAVEADRVMKQGAVLAVWTYGLLSVHEKFDVLLKYFYSDILGVFWPFERKMVEGGYADIILPFAEIPSVPMQMTEQWSFIDVIGYLNTWSAVRAYEREHGSNPLELVYDDMLKVWGESNGLHITMWPLKLRVWQKGHNP
jgi:ubiquinone/menaquinone biosynthesis C-methylase UbiE